MRVSPEAFFLPISAAPGGGRFCLFYPAQSAEPRGLVLYIHPFAEEMNKSRRMAALQSRALAQAGYSVLQIDLVGCGDSSGDFGDATWQRWVDDVREGFHWLRGHRNSMAPGLEQPPIWLWGLRAGCLLAVEAAQQLGEPCHFVFWQPPASGKLLLQQFLRLKVAGDLLGGQSKGILQSVRQQLAAGATVEIAGYLLGPGLASGLENATPNPPMVRDAKGLRMAWLELSTREDASFSPVSSQSIDKWQQAGFLVASRIVQGPAFWQTTEIEDALALIEATTEMLDSECYT